MTLFETAQAYTQLGYVCVPVNVSLNADGHKVVDAPLWKNRVFDKESDWAGYTGIAFNTGASGIVAIDIDCDDEKDGFANLAAAGIELPETPIKATTQSGGEHRIYRRGETPVKSSSGLLAKHVDVRAEGGLLFVAPTAVEGTDRSYRWQPGSQSLPVSDLPVFPEALAQRLVIDQTRKITAPERFSPTDVTTEQRDWACRKIDYKLKDLASASPGERNQWLGRTVPRIIGLAKTLGENLEATAEKILAAYRESGGDDETQCRGWIASALKHCSAEDPNQWLQPDQERLFWDSRPELRQIRQAAYAGMASPWAVLGALCVRVLADVPPGHRLITGIGDPVGGNLNLFAVLAAESGGGKGVATQVARHLWPSDVYSVEIASGEALPKLFAKKVRDPVSGDFATEWIRDSVIIDAPEFGSLSASGSRTGATLTQRLCNGFSGEGLSFAVSDDSKNVEVLPNSYRLGVITGVQYGNAGLLLSEAASVTGVPQRFVWFPANVKAEDLPDVRPDMPGPLTQRQFPGGVFQIPVCDEAKQDMESAQRAKLVGDKTSPLDGHKLYARVKLAYALAVLNGHYSSVRSQDWWLSGVVIGVSDSTRQRAVETLRNRSRKEAVAAGQRDGIRKAAAAEVEAEAVIERVADRVLHLLNDSPDGLPVRGRDGVKQKLRGSQREYVTEAVDLLVRQGKAIADDGEPDSAGEPLGWVRLVGRTP